MSSAQAAQFVLDWAFDLPRLWVSAAGGTANVLAGELSRFAGVSFQESSDLLDQVGGPNWYPDLHSHHGGWLWVDDFSGYPDPRVVRKALERRFIKPYQGERWEEWWDCLPLARGNKGRIAA